MSDFKFPAPNAARTFSATSAMPGMQIPVRAAKPCRPFRRRRQRCPQSPAFPSTRPRTIRRRRHPALPTRPPSQPGATKLRPSSQAGKFPTAAIGSVVALLAAGAIAWFDFGAPHRAPAPKSRKKSRPRRPASRGKKKADEEAARPAAQARAEARSANTLFPDRPAAGKEHGVDFTVRPCRSRTVFSRSGRTAAPAGSPSSRCR